jgi:hypothetical protein
MSTLEWLECRRCAATFGEAAELSINGGNGKPSRVHLRTNESNQVFTFGRREWFVRISSRIATTETLQTY